MKAKSVLVVDDEEDIRALVQHWMTEAGHSVEVATNAKEGVQRAEKSGFDLVITDVLMPDGDGLELIAALKVVLPSAKVLAISGGGRYIESDNCLKIAKGWGAHALLMKPFGRDELLAAVDQAFTPPATPSLW